MKPFLSGFKALIIGIITRVLANICLLLATWLTAKGWLTQIESNAITSVLLTVGVALAGLAIDWAISTRAAEWIEDVVERTSVKDAAKVLAVTTLLAGMVGCAYSTPAEAYKRDALIVNAATVAVNGAKLTGKGESPIVQKAEPVIVQAQGIMAEFYDWLEANPMLADVPGAPCPPREKLRALIPAVRRYWLVLTTGLVPITPPVPTSQPIPYPH